MRTSLYVTTLLTVLLLQSCGSQATRSESDTPDDSQRLSDHAANEADKNQDSQNTSQINRAGNEKLTTPETQIIRELHHAGCLIEDFELDRRKQNMRISCAKDIQSDKSSI